MRHYRIIIILFLGVFLITSSCSKKSIDFNCKFTSNKKYIQTTTSHSVNEVHYSGDKEFMDRMLANNPDNPQKTETNSTIITSTLSGEEKNGSIHTLSGSKK